MEYGALDHVGPKVSQCLSITISFEYIYIAGTAKAADTQVRKLQNLSPFLVYNRHFSLKISCNNSSLHNNRALGRGGVANDLQ